MFTTLLMEDRMRFPGKPFVGAYGQATAVIRT